MGRPTRPDIAGRPRRGAQLESTPWTARSALDGLGVHEALSDLERLDARQARVVELKFFVGLSLAEIAELLELSVATVSREWSMARVWLHERLSE